jgi:hypothetical protein
MGWRRRRVWECQSALAVLELDVMLAIQQRHARGMIAASRKETRVREDRLSASQDAAILGSASGEVCFRQCVLQGTASRGKHAWRRVCASPYRDAAAFALPGYRRAVLWECIARHITPSSACSGRSEEHAYDEETPSERSWRTFLCIRRRMNMEPSVGDRGSAREARRGRRKPPGALGGQFCSAGAA